MTIQVPDGTMVLEPRDTFDPAIVGVVHQGGVTMAVYSREKTIDRLVDHEGLTYDDAVEHYDFNVSGSIGVGYPVFLIDDLDGDPDDEPGS